MKLKFLLFGIILGLTAFHIHAQQSSFSFKADITVSQEIKAQFNENGRLYLFFSKNPRDEPRTQTWPSPVDPTAIFAKNINGFKSNEVLTIENPANWISTTDWKFDDIPKGEYYVQIVWDQDNQESRIDAPGNLYSETQKIVVDQPIKLMLTLNQIIESRTIDSHPLVREIDFNSKLLSKWWNKPVNLKASILLPHGYDNTKAYPIRYNVAGYGGRYTRINGLVSYPEFINWWDSDEAPQIINVFLDGEGPFGDSYQMNSENSGPYGDALINELIPHIEAKYRGTTTSTTRFVDGCSTGGWVSLGLQLYYPDFFNGVFSYSPDAVEFENYQLINIYKDKNAFVNEFGYLRPVMRNTDGEPMLSLKDFMQYENVLGSSNSYLNSGGQFSAHTALYSPKGSNGLPKPLFDPLSGAIDSVVAQHWKKYDFKLYAQEHWEELGPKLEGKIFIWMGDMDHFYLNSATRVFASFFKQTTNPKSDAEIVFTPMAGHCSEYSHLTVLQMMQEKIEENEAKGMKSNKK